ncbi:MAG: deoxynucleoside kinase [Cetobacterium sp.]
MTVKIFCIDGNIGSGKTTILNELKNRGYCVYEEELSEWGELLNRFYSDQKRWMCTLQVAILHSMQQQYKNLTQDNQKKIVFIERSPQSSMIFVKNGVKQGFIDNEEANVIKNIYNDLYWKPDKVFYLDTDVNLCYDRMKLRGRECEKNVTKDYLQFINDEYSHLYNDQNAFILQNNKNTSLQVLIDQILKHTNQT